MVDRPKRVPPPPPPGFGDEDYYKLYGEPEEYQRYRRELTEKLKWKGGDSPPQHEEYSVYRRYKSYEESYDYYCGPRQAEWDAREGGRAPPKRRIAPPPPPGFEDTPSPRGPKKRVAPPPPSPSRRGKKEEEEGSASGSEACAVFKNFRVTIKNDSDGTPSLSDSDEEMDRKGKRKRKRKRKEREREKRKKLEKKLKKREEELKAVKEKRINSEPDLRDEIIQRRDESAGRGKKLSVIDRLGERPPVGDRADLRDRRLGRDGERRGGGPEPRGRRSPIRVRASLEKSRREDLIRRAELRKDKPENIRDRGKSLGKRNRSKSPLKPRARLGSRSRGRRRGSLSPGRKSKSMGRRSRSPLGRSRSMGNRSKSRGNIRRKSRSKDRRSLSDLRKKRSLSKGRSASRNRRRRNRSRTPLKRAGDRGRNGDRGNGGRGRRKKRKKKRKRGELRRSDKLRLEDMKEENEEMQAKLLEKRKKGGANQEGLLGRLAEMAGMGNLPAGFKSEDGKTRNAKSGSRSSSSDDSSHSSGSSSEDEYDSESGSESDDPKRGGRKRGNSGKRDKRFFWEKEGGKLKSDVVKKDGKNNGKSAKDKESEVKDLKDERSPDRKRSSTGKWKHDKFMESQLSPKKEREEAFGSHWSKIRSERSKERERNKSQSRSKSRTRSRSRSRSATPRRSRKRRRRGKFSRSRSSSESSRSRSWSSSRHSSYSSRSSTKSKSPAGKKGPSPGTATTSKKAKDAEVVIVGDEKEGGKEGVNLGLSGALTAESNTVNGVVVKYCEPQEARKPKKKWRLYVFKGNEELPILYIHRQSAYLLGRDRKVADVPLDHPSCSKQHAALQYRLVNYTREDGTAGRRVQLYVMDLGSANGTFVNNSRIEASKYIQLLEKDVLKFGFSSREYVLLHDQSKVDNEEDEGLD